MSDFHNVNKHEKQYHVFYVISLEHKKNKLNPYA